MWLILLFLIVFICAAVFAFRYKRYAGLFFWPCRILVGGFLIWFGIAKIPFFGGEQLHRHDFEISSKNLDLSKFVFQFFGHTKLYSQFIAYSELLAGVLILIPKTTLIGALLALPIWLNITIITFAYEFAGIQYINAFMTLIVIILLIKDHQKLKGLFH